MLSEENRREKASSSNRGNTTFFWRGIWKLIVPGKIKHFFMKGLFKCPANEDELNGKEDFGQQSELCAKAPESISYALWECEVIQPVWNHSFGWVDRNRLSQGSFCDLLNMTCDKPHLLELFATTVHLQELVLPLNKVAAEAQHYLASFRNGNIQRRMKQPRTRAKWKPPPDGIYKTNFDGTIFEETGEAGIGVVVWNFKGEVMASLSEKIMYPSSVEMVELLSRAVLFTQEVGLRDTIVKGDSATVISALQNGKMLKSSMGHLINDTLSFVSFFWSLFFSHTLRQDNARRTRFCFPFEAWMESVTPDISVFPLFCNFCYLILQLLE